jgi:uncharacterized membrane protein
MPLLLAFALGMCTGLRSLVVPTVLAWAAQFALPDLRQTSFAFLAAPVTAYVLTALACAELVGDKLPFTPSRLMLAPFATRVVMGSVCASALFAATHQSILIGGLAGGIGAGIGAYVGYHVRRMLVTKGKIPDFLVALAEDAVAISAAIYIATRFISHS